MGTPNRLPNDPRKVDARRTGPRPVSGLDGGTNLRPQPLGTRNRPGLASVLLAIAVGVVVLTLLGLLMYKNFMKPSPRTPENPNSKIQQSAPIQPVSAAKLFPLCRRREQQKQTPVVATASLDQR